MVATVVGKPVKVDKKNTLKVERGKSVRICVEIHIPQWVVGKVWLNGYWYKVECERLHLICLACDCYGHLARNCSLQPVAPLEASMAQARRTHKTLKRLQIRKLIFEQKKKGSAKPPIITNKVEPNVHGEWMIVNRKKGPHLIIKILPKKGHELAKSSRFIALQKENDEAKWVTERESGKNWWGIYPKISWSNDGSEGAKVLE